MNAERWRVVEKIFHEVLEREPSDREAFLDRACNNDESLKKEVAALVRSDNQAGNFLRSRSVTTTSVEFVGMRVGPYEIQAEIGSGGFLATHRKAPTASTHSWLPPPARKSCLKSFAPRACRHPQVYIRRIYVTLERRPTSLEIPIVRQEA